MTVNQAMRNALRGCKSNVELFFQIDATAQIAWALSGVRYLELF